MKHSIAWWIAIADDLAAYGSGALARGMAAKDRALVVHGQWCLRQAESQKANAERHAQIMDVP